jgi:hypothetical protein
MVVFSPIGAVPRACSVATLSASASIEINVVATNNARDKTRASEGISSAL